jgi:hypothetical protein
MIRSRAAWTSAVVLAAAAAAARLPQLLSPNLLADGDESLLGLMGMHVASGRDFPLFFYGQKYGLAIVEAPAAAVSFTLFGAGPVTLKAAILVIWIAGALFYFRAFARVLGTRRSFWITLLFVLMPAWATTSMKGWSGYVTAFAAAGLLLDLVTRQHGLVSERSAEQRAASREPRAASREERAASREEREVRWLAAGGVTAVVYLAQPLWLPSLAPIVLYHLVSSRRLRCWAAYGCGTILPIAAMAAVKQYWLAEANEVWFTPGVGNPNLLASVPATIRQIYVNLTGSWHLAATIVPGRVTAAMAGLWFGLLIVLLVMQGYRLVTRRHLAWSYLLAASIVLTLVSNWVLLEERAARYLLPMNVPLVFLAGVELFDLADRFPGSLQRCVAAIVLVAAVQAVAMREFAGYTFMWWTNTPDSPSETKTLNTVIGYLASRGVTRVYSTNALLPWTIAFYSHESIVARWKGWRDRYPPYIQAVDRALQAGRPVAIVGYTGYTYGLEQLVPDPRAIVDIDGKYFVYLAPDRELLTRAGFRLVR